MLCCQINEIPMDSYQKKNALNYCFQSQYLITLLTAYGFNESNWHTISFVKKVCLVKILGYCVKFDHLIKVLG